MLIKSKDLIINFDKANFNQKNSIIEANGNVKLIIQMKIFYLIRKNYL